MAKYPTAVLAPHDARKQPAVAALAAPGIVYGDIGTSTLYGFKQAVEAGGGAILAVPGALLCLTALAAGSPAGVSGLGNAGPHGFSEVLYAYTSAANANGGAFADLSANTGFYHAITRASSPSTTVVCVASNVDEAGLWLKSMLTSGAVL